MDISNTAEFKVERRSVNSKSLCDTITKEVENLITGAGVMWGSDTHRAGFVDTVQDYLFQLEETDVIMQGNAICDMRNNTVEQMDKGVYTFEVAYRQKHCLNTTRVIYTIKDLLVSSIKELLDLEIAP